MTRKVAIVTGGASGIGAATVRSLMKNGYTVVSADITHETDLENCGTDLPASQNPVELKVDVTEDADLERLIAAVDSSFGHIDVMVNNAGHGAYGPVNSVSDSEFDHIMRLNAYAAFRGTKYAAQSMIENGVEGVIVTVCSASGILATPQLFSYNVAKAASIMIVKSAAVDLADHGIRVVGVAPGAVATPITRKYSEAGPEVEASYLKKHVRAEWLRPEQIADAIAFLASDAAGGINGSVISVDDGYTTFK